MVPFALWILFAAYVAVFGRPVFAIVDTICFVKKKPYVYKWEIKRMMKSPRAMEELFVQEATRENVGQSMQDLKNMLDQNIISAEEFEKKKAELLSMM
ncbi:MAG: SHOCT domain-containing protein [Ruminococcus sp.]|nr:SHOCT domain-containing protein [Ruminococcus sp.]